MDNSLRLTSRTTASEVERFLRDAKGHHTLRARTENGATILYTAAETSKVAGSLGSLSVGKNDFAESTAARNALDALFGTTTFSARPEPLQVTRALRLLDAPLLLESLTGGEDTDLGMMPMSSAQASVDVYMFDSDSETASSDGSRSERKSSQSRSSIGSGSMSTPGPAPASASAAAEESPADKAGILDASAFGSLKKTDGTHSGGQTGSKTYDLTLPNGLRTKAQVKLQCNTFRGLGKGGVYAENLRELFGARMVRAMNAEVARGRNDAAREGLVPEVSLIREEGNPELRIASVFLSPKGNPKLQDHAVEKGAKLSKGDKGRVRVALESPHAARPAASPAGGPAPAKVPTDVFVVKDKQLIEDICLNTALSIAALDHDMNHGNEVMVEAGSDARPGDLKSAGSPSGAPGAASKSLRVGRIDFGHAFGDMLMAPAGFGGGFKKGGNLALDFINRETLANTSPGGGKSKIWRDFIGLVPRKELADALRLVASSKEARNGLHEAGEQLRVIAQDLECHPRDTSPEAKAKRDESAKIAESLASMCSKLGMEVNRDLSLRNLVTEVENNLVRFMDKHQRDMEHVANLCELQAKIDELIALPADRKDSEASRAIRADIESLHKKVETVAGKKITWLKVVADRPAFQGTLDAYIEHRTHRARPMAL